MADHPSSPGADLASASGESVANISEDLESSTNSVAARVVTPTLPLIGRLRMPTDAPTHPAVPQSPFGPPERDFVPASPSIMSLSHLLEKFDNDDDDVVIYAGSGNPELAAESLKEYGADRVTVCVTHAVLSGKDSVENIVNSDAIDLFVCTDTIPVVNENRVLPECEKVVVLSVAELIAEVMLRVHYSGVPHKPGKRTPVSTPRQLHFDTEDNIG